MGVEYNGVGGIGIKVNDYIDHFLKNEEFRTLWEKQGYCEAVETIIERKVPAGYNIAGSAYSGDEWFYLIINGNSLLDVMKNSIPFMNHLYEKYNIELSSKDLIVISDYHVW